MAEQTAPSGKGGGNFLTKKYGKLKGWQIMALVAGGVGVIYYIRKSQANAAANTAATTPTTADTSLSPLPGLDGTGLQAAVDQAGQQSSSDAETLQQQAQQIAALQDSTAKAQHAADVANNKINHLPTLAAIQRNLRAHAPKAAAKKPPAKRAPKPAPKRPAPKKVAAAKPASTGAPLPVAAGVPR